MSTPSTFDRSSCDVAREPFSAEWLNRECFCIAVDRDALHAEVEALLEADGLSASLADSHPHLFSNLPVFVSRMHLEQAARTVAALEQAISLLAYREAVLGRAPDIAAFDPGSPGGLLGLDFHLHHDGPRLIEINTNPGGVLLNELMARAQTCCVPPTIYAGAPAGVEDAVIEVLLTEWRAQQGDRPLRRVAIVDEAPAAQYLYPEFLQFRALLQRHGYAAEVCSPVELVRRDGAVWLGSQRVDFIYNRLTDFALGQPAHSSIRAAYLAGEVAISPHPRAHALYADKRNLALLGDRAFLESARLDADAIETLVAAVPETRLLTANNRDALWSDRRRWFFKPAAGYGSKASYRGDKLTRKVWGEMEAATYVAQRIVVPSERRSGHDAQALKVDIRCYAYGGRVLLHAARLYQGQTTNFRTPGGGFAPVLTGG
ncbi:MAG: FIG00715019: hypothetical protein [uncultured Lysobacter sp.]|uniref:Circularly permuted type 2 ATP-grasp protein n=1 Tax=uncultured Lysobacter sp. TaxID=271060 RepID=A0A6J4KSM6_9GAMM|nr:MAG: FIG00715019: hypothetical protein [uncultured Lysobacter sp.]